ncbi:DUF58 domain-containing protein [Rathayibacter iranicus]|uniref:DUF58 domain-containing protein n=2 Tax=Rathayibacter iranicus TaxID=59737 RepID=A0AAD1AC46_9MICO|nr:DUF58 domain-containing protein [Rathayibacter iranicus]AZZ55508.1 DUF58 domain-containing protein [Rathayibacter iranicus]MWV31660.1 DUF58 domain-containing protein [Rathayibacter iranicus NCPPB 2253 = VKM Ac-1602]PPI48297.1 hypothetical protein C5E09_05225 [Rathayibacter iranicus]PPI60928.1 hypothetical protein C5E08_06130 [Rathayibacter iranicus]PPI72543.1 hypothetical protein C5E01_04485 [Rathayibacter iranicus]
MATEARETEAPSASLRGLPALAGVALTLRGWVLVLLGLAGVVIAPLAEFRELLFLGLVLLGLPLGALVSLVLSTPSFRVQRRFAPQTVSAGDIVEVDVVLENRAGALRAGASAQDRLERIERGAVVGRAVAEGKFALPAVSPRGRVRARYRLPAERRGIHRIGPLRLVRGDGLGLAVRESIVGAAQPFVVTPRAVPLQSDVLDARGAGGSSPVAHATAGAGTDDVIPRDYRPGDAMRRVHWRASARSGELMVRQDEQSTDPHAWILLETRAERIADRRGDERLEWAVSMTASLAVHLLERGFETHLVETGATEEGEHSEDEREVAHDVLLRLAELVPSQESVPAVPRVVAQMREAQGVRPVFAVLSRLHEEDLDALATLATHARPAIAFLVGGTAEEEGALAALGWYPVVVDPDSSVEDAWAQALALRVVT